jgi:N-acetylglucosamine-6-sulfatase
MANIDVAPTLLDYAGAEIPEEMQGLSCRGMLRGDPEAARREAVYFRYWMHLAHGLHVPAHYGIRTDRWKLIFYYGLPLDATGAQEEKTPAGWELYDMKADPLELRNLYGEPARAGVAADVRQKLDHAKQRYGDTDEQYPELRERYGETQ